MRLYRERDSLNETDPLRVSNGGATCPLDPFRVAAHPIRLCRSTTTDLVRGWRSWSTRHAFL